MRIVAAPPATPPATPCEACCEKSCCGEKLAVETTGATSPCCQGECDGTSQNQAAIERYLAWPLAPIAPSAISLAAVPQTCQKSACGHGGCDSRPTTTAATFPSSTTVLYSAIPAGVPSPFARGNEIGHISPPLIATQAYAAELPLQQPPAPVLQASACASAANPTGCPSHAASATTAEPCCKAQQVLFNIDVIEDQSGSLAEFDALKSDMPFLTADSEIILATLRILEKQQLIRRVSSPRLVTVEGRSAVFQIGSETAVEGESQPCFDGIRLEVSARGQDERLEVQFHFRQSSGPRANEVMTRIGVSEGQTVVMKTSCQRKETGADGEPQSQDDVPVYVVLTPALVK